MDRNISRRQFAGLAAATLASLGLGACAPAQDAGEGSGSTQGSAAGEGSAAAQPDVVRVAALKGPTSIGLAALMKAQDEGTAKQNYEFSMSTAADEVVPQLLQAGVDIALVPANVASVVYNRSEGEILAIDINTLGVLYVVCADGSVSSFADLADKTVFMTGKGATPEYVMNFLLTQAGIADSVTLEFKDEPTEVVAALTADAAAVAVLPEPFVTASLTKNENIKRVLSLDEEWSNLASDGGSKLVTGVTVCRKGFLESYPEAVLTFLDEHAASVEAVNADPDTYGQVVADLGIIDAAPVAAKAIPNCNLVCVRASEMQTMLSGYLDVLYDANPESVGGSLPRDNFYFLG